MNSDTIRDDPIQLAHTLRAFAELRQTGAVTEAEYESLKVDVLAALALRIKRDPADRPLVGGASPGRLDIGEHADDLHRMIADALSQEYPKASTSLPFPDAQKRYCLDLAARLLSRGALVVDDMPSITKIVQTIMDDGHSKSLEAMVKGQMQINAVRREIRERAAGSELARTIAGIVSDSANKAVDLEATAVPPGEPVVAQNRRSNLWNAVKEDGMGAMVGAATASTIIAGPQFPLAALALLSPLGPTAVVVPTLGALIGGGMMSGIALAESRS